MAFARSPLARASMACFDRPGASRGADIDAPHTQVVVVAEALHGIEIGLERRGVLARCAQRVDQRQTQTQDVGPQRNGLRHARYRATEILVVVGAYPCRARSKACPVSALGSGATARRLPEAIRVSSCRRRATRLASGPICAIASPIAATRLRPVATGFERVGEQDAQVHHVGPLSDRFACIGRAAGVLMFAVFEVGALRDNQRFATERQGDGLVCGRSGNGSHIDAADADHRGDRTVHRGFQRSAPAGFAKHARGPHAITPAAPRNSRCMSRARLSACGEMTSRATM